MHRLLLVLAFLMLASSAQAVDIAKTAWVNKRGSVMLVPIHSQIWAGWYSSNETTTPQQCRNNKGQILIIYEASAPASAMWTLNWPPNVQRKFDYHFHAHELPNLPVSCPEETVWAVSVADNPFRLCTIWTKRLASGQIKQGRDVFWSVPYESLPITGPYVWPRGVNIKRSACRPVKKYLGDVVVSPAPKNYPVWPPFFGPVWR
jgi:hypothetical protein